MYIKESNLHINDLIMTCSNDTLFPDKESFIKCACDMLTKDFDEILLAKIECGQSPNISYSSQQNAFNSVINIATSIWEAIREEDVQPDELYDIRFDTFKFNENGL